jgi:hypothetical protein
LDGFGCCFRPVGFEFYADGEFEEYDGEEGVNEDADYCVEYPQAEVNWNCKGENHH